MSSAVICPTCGHPNDVDASFCERDDTWLGGEHRRAEPADDGGAAQEGSGDRRDDPTTATGGLVAGPPTGRDREADPTGEPPTGPPGGLGAVDPRRVRERAERAARRRGTVPDDGTAASPSPSTSSSPGQDQDPDPTAPGPSANTAGTAVRPDRPDLSGPRCRTCGRLAPAGATVCDCGEPLAAAPGPGSGRDRTARRPGRDEAMLGRFAFSRAQRRANDGRRPTFDRPLAPRVVWFRATTLAVLAALVVAVLAGWHRTVADSVGGLVARVVPGMVEQIEVESTQVAGATDDDGTSLNAVDGTDLAWEVPWDPDAAAAAECGTVPGGAPLLRITFAGTTSVSRVTLLPGLGQDDRRRSLQHRPRRVDIVFDDGTCVEVPLPDDIAAVDLDLPAPVASTAGATVAIVDAYPKAEGGEDLVAIREISFGRR